MASKICSGDTPILEEAAGCAIEVANRPRACVRVRIAGRVRHINGRAKNHVPIEAVVLRLAPFVRGVRVLLREIVGA